MPEVDFETGNVITAGSARYVFPLDPLTTTDDGPGYVRQRGPVVSGRRMQVCVIRMPKGTGAHAHCHPNEQWIYVLQGTLESEVAGVKTRVATGSLLYIPADAMHSAVATADEDVLFLTVKDTRRRLLRSYARATVPRPLWSALRRAKRMWRTLRTPR